MAIMGSHNGMTIQKKPSEKEKSVSKPPENELPLDEEFVVSYLYGERPELAVSGSRVRVVYNATGSSLIIDYMCRQLIHAVHDRPAGVIDFADLEPEALQKIERLRERIGAYSKETQSKPVAVKRGFKMS